MAPFWTCLIASDPPATVADTRARLAPLVIAQHEARGGAMASEIRARCRPQLGAAMGALAALAPPEEKRVVYDNYRASLVRFAEALDEFTIDLERRARDEETDARIQSVAAAWQSGGAATADGRKFGALIGCAITNAKQIDGLDALMNAFIDACFKGDPVPFMDHVHEACAPTLDQPAGAVDLHVVRFEDPGGRSARAWQRCARASVEVRDGKALGPVVEAVAAALDARATL